MTKNLHVRQKSLESRVKPWQHISQSMLQIDAISGFNVLDYQDYVPLRNETSSSSFCLCSRARVRVGEAIEW